MFLQVQATAGAIGPPLCRTQVTFPANAFAAFYKLARPVSPRVGINSNLLRRGHGQYLERMRSLRLHVGHGRALRLGKGDL